MDKGRNTVKKFYKLLMEFKEEFESVKQVFEKLPKLSNWLKVCVNPCSSVADNNSF